MTILTHSEYIEEDELNDYSEFLSTIDYCIDHIKAYPLPGFVLFGALEISPKLRQRVITAISAPIIAFVVSWLLKHAKSTVLGT